MGMEMQIKSEDERGYRRMRERKKALFKYMLGERKIYELVLKYIVAYSRGFFPGKPGC